MSVVIRNRLELQDKPVAVCHSDSPKGTAEISSANYPARAYGLSYTKVIFLKLSYAMGHVFSAFVLTCCNFLNLGVKAGMFVRHAKDLCPQLVIVPYNFEAYEEVFFWS